MEITQDLIDKFCKVPYRKGVHGRFHIFDEKKKKLLTLDNQICTAGAESFLKMMFRGTTSDVSVGGNFYLGLCGSHAAFADTLADVVNEPTTGGYARQAITRDTTGFPTISTVNGIWRALSKSVTFAASGANYDHESVRAFLCNASSGTTGILYAYSGALATPITVLDGASYPATYEFYLN